MVLQIILLVILICINGIFAASEIAFLSVNKLSLSQNMKNGDKKAVKIKKILDNPSSFLATIQIGITLAGFLASAFAAEAFADLIIENLNFLNLDRIILKPIVVIIVTMILSYFTLVFGELVPKRLAMNYSEKIAYLMVNSINILSKITYPFVWLLTKSTNFFSKLLGVKEKEDQAVTEEDIKLIIAEGRDIGSIEPDETNYIYNVFKFNDTKVNQVMTAKSDTVMIDINIGAKELLKVIKQSKYTRFPVYTENENNIIGIFNTKDIIFNYSKDKKLDLKQIIQEPYFVDENDIIDDVFKELKDRQQAIAIVMKNDEEFVGIITVEDILEEIVGNIFDEYDEI